MYVALLKYFVGITMFVARFTFVTTLDLALDSAPLKKKRKEKKKKRKVPGAQPAVVSSVTDG